MRTLTITLSPQDCAVLGCALRQREERDLQFAKDDPEDAEYWREDAKVCVFLRRQLDAAWDAAST